MTFPFNIKPVVICTQYNYRYRYIVSTIIYSVLIIFILSSCKERISYSPPIQKAIELFYIENENDSILQLLSADLQLNSQDIVLRDIFTAAALCEKGDVDSASTLFSGIKIDEKDKILSYWHKHIGGLILFRKNKPTEAYKVLERATSGTCYDIRANALSERLIARILLFYGNNQEGIKWIVKSSQHFQQVGLGKSIGINKKILGRYYMNIGNQREALYFFEKSECILKKFDDIAELYYIYINLNEYYVKTNNLEEAVKYADICLNILKDWNDNQMKTVLYNILGEIKLKQNKTDEAEAYFQTALKLSVNFMTADIEASIALIFLSKIYHERANRSQAIEYALRAQKLFTGQSRHLQSQYDVYNQLSALYSILPNKDKYNSYKDSVDFYYNLLQEERANLSKNIYDIRTELLQMSYNIEQLKNNERNQRTVIIIVATAFVCLIIMLVLLYRRWKSKNLLLKSLARKNIQMVEEERRKLKEIQQQFAVRGTFRKQIDENRAQFIYAQIIEWLQENENYKLTDLTIDQLAYELNTNREYISQAINANGIKFNELINRFRINEVINILSDPTNKLFAQKMSVIASEVGYKSESVFFDAFKKQTGMTPAQFRAAEKDLAEQAP
ncbi:MAG: helix-turn-helix domain-containing protein [Bacteroidia bacterium]|nr:helix-turn-helix domain-containing protein [Bacteroidia bacterium]